MYLWKWTYKYQLYGKINLTIAGKSMKLYEINKQLKVARQKTFIFNQIKKLTKKIYSNLTKINMRYYLKFRIPFCHTQFSEQFLKIQKMWELIVLIQIIIFILWFVIGWLTSKLRKCENWFFLKILSFNSLLKTFSTIYKMSYSF